MLIKIVNVLPELQEAFTGHPLPQLSDLCGNIVRKAGVSLSSVQSSDNWDLHRNTNTRTTIFKNTHLGIQPLRIQTLEIQSLYLIKPSIIRTVISLG